MILGWFPLRIVSVGSKMAAFSRHNGPLLDPFQNCISVWPMVHSKMATICQHSFYILESYGKNNEKSSHMKLHMANWNKTLMKWSFGGPLSELCILDLWFKLAAISGHSFTWDPMGKTMKNLLIWNCVAWPIGTKIGWNGLLVDSIQNYIRWTKWNCFLKQLAKIVESTF